jgi:hypothetical protein
MPGGDHHGIDIVGIQHALGVAGTSRPEAGRDVRRREPALRGDGSELSAVALQRRKQRSLRERAGAHQADAKRRRAGPLGGRR